MNCIMEVAVVAQGAGRLGLRVRNADERAVCIRARRHGSTRLAAPVPRCPKDRASGERRAQSVASAAHTVVLSADEARMQRVPLWFPAADSLRAHVQAERLHAHRAHDHKRRRFHEADVATGTATAGIRHGGRVVDEHQEGPSGHAEQHRRVPRSAERLPGRRDHPKVRRVRAADLCGTRRAASASTTPSSDSRIAHIRSRADLLYGVTLHNNPTMQDVWNTVPAWGFPFIGSSAAPTPSAGALVDGALGQQVVGLGAYGLWNKLVYAELTGVSLCPAGHLTAPRLGCERRRAQCDSVLALALQHQFGPNYFMIGTYGLSAHFFPTGVSGLTDRYTDLAGDLQFERQIQTGVVVFRSTYIHESQHSDALTTGAEPGAANLQNTLNVFRANASYMPSIRFNFTAGYFNTSGTRDAILYPSEPLTGSANGSPNSSGASRRNRLQRVAERPPRSTIRGVREVQRRRRSRTMEPAAAHPTTTRFTCSPGWLSKGGDTTESMHSYRSARVGGVREWSGAVPDTFRSDARAFTVRTTCESRDSNPDGFPHWILSPARLPIPPLPRGPAAQY